MTAIYNSGPLLRNILTHLFHLIFFANKEDVAQ